MLSMMLLSQQLLLPLLLYSNIAGLLYKLKSYGILGQLFGLIFSFLSHHKNIQLMLEFVKALFLILHFSYYTLMTFLMMLSVILLSMLMILLYSKCDQVSDLWQQLELASELESDLQHTVDWGKKWHVDFISRKTQLVSFGRSNNTGSINVKMDVSVLEEK